jgi:SAM-dependent methyltransferase
VTTESLKPYARLSEVYDLGWSSFPERCIPFLLSFLQRRRLSDARVLDIACGTGTIAEALCRAGHRVHGVDLSPQMISLAQEKAADLPQAAFEVKDMRGLRARGTFDLAICTFDSLNYLLTPSDLRATFRGVSSALKPSGVFVFDSNTEKHYADRFPLSLRREWGGQTVHQEGTYDASAGIATIVFRFADGLSEVHRQHPYELETLIPLLAEVELAPTELYSDPERHAYEAVSTRLVCVAESSHPGPQAVAGPTR